MINNPLSNNNFSFTKSFTVKGLFILCLVVCSALQSHAQSDTTYLYLKFPTLPPVNIIKAPDSIRFTKADMSKKTATLIMVFSPDCGHCQHETEDLVAHIDLFKKVQILMATPLEYSYVRKFYTDYKIGDYPNITIGTDPGYMLGTFFHVRSLPALFLYDRNGDFVKAFDGSVSALKIAESL